MTKTTTIYLYWVSDTVSCLFFIRFLSSTVTTFVCEKQSRNYHQKIRNFLIRVTCNHNPKLFVSFLPCFASFDKI